MKISLYQRYREHLLATLSRWQGDEFLRNVQATRYDFHDAGGMPSMSQHMQSQLDIIDSDIETVIQQVTDLSQHLVEMPDIIQDWVLNSQEPYLRRSHELYRYNFQDFRPEVIFPQQLNYAGHQKSLLLRHIHRLVRPYEMGMIIRPGNQDWLDVALMFDQTYLFDNSADLVAPAWFNAPETLQDKLLCYHGLDTRPFEQLPRGQMSVIFANSFFNYKSLEVIYHYLWEFSTLLSPTGSVIMTFNDCDHAVNTELFEAEHQCYTPTTMICNRAQELGFVVANREWWDDGVAWIELRREDKKYRNIKAGAILTKIHARSK